MDATLALQAVFLGIVEGLTEFLPVSSTGHLILVGDLLDFRGPTSTVFDVVIQLGAILAVVVGFFPRLARVALTLHEDAASRRFAVAVLLAFLPAAVVGVFAHDFIKAALFSPWVVSVALVVGGIVLIVIERYVGEPRVFEVESFSASLALKIGCFQVLSMVPGVSRAGATIVGALLLGVERRTAAEFSFFLAIPTMLGASTLDLYKSRDLLTMSDAGMIAIGFVAAFLSAMIVVRTFVGFVGRHGFAAFGWYRIVIGGLMLVLLAARG
jgi:undecaprenyl-diphosphatase